jgi:FAD/FMN-containing dehydrogenase
MNAPFPAPAADLKESLKRLLGPAHARDDEATLALCAEDVYARAECAPAIVVAPSALDDLVAIMRLAAASRAPVIARGAGLSYTGGYLPAAPGAVMIDMTRMNRVVEINATDMLVRVEAGATWAGLDAALKERGLRTPFWGPLSGRASTIGGGLSQNNAFFGAGTCGPASDSVVALKVVLAGGAVIDTGAHAASGRAGFFRAFGPDLAGLFLGDSGALGIKAEATLRLIERPAAEGFASFAFAAPAPMLAAMSALARAGAFSEIFGFDPKLQRVRMKRAGLAADVKALAAVVKSGKSLLSGVREAARIAAAGRGFIEADEYSVHVVAEGRSEAAVATDLDRARAIARAAGGREIENTIPKVVRAEPFGPLNAMVGPEGERWAPVHGILAHSAAPAAFAAIEDLFARLAPEFEAAGVHTGCLSTTLSTNALLIEPVFYWPSALGPIHRASIEPSHLERLPAHAPNPAADALVARARKAVMDIFLAHGAAHFQIGKAYPYCAARSPEAFALLDAIKSALDPERRINPGALGLI